MINKAFAALTVGFGLSVPALPALTDEATTPESEEGRYTFNKIADGFIRLDMQTGEVSTCTQRTVGWACHAVPEDRAVLENEIARLRTENALLKRDLISRGLALPPAVQEDGRLRRGGTGIDRMAFVGRVWHRLVEVIARTEKQVLNKS
jgi:hypothetical protein